ncbi:hypothetical protein [Chitinophaga sp. S165]|uniref:hypothetical protein n=1 Tax=Chitinophaga sp. S165 TaxID=2135462 RepID=UPI000D715C86|nr:hypothetical protein [Chitinophaga sp. S165]PWV47671.1 hypothetical protein C7475_108238 [Chitinophaga sp. S165]
MKILNILVVLLALSYTTYAQSGKKDTVFLLKEKRETGYHAIFIDKNPRSEFYKKISDFRFSDDESRIYAGYLDYLKGQRLPRFTDRTFPRKWIVIYQYKKKFYAYYPSDFMSHYQVRVTDSTYIDYIGGEGPVANKIKSFSIVDSSTYRFRLVGGLAKDRKLTVHIIDPQKGIAVFEEDVTGWGKRYFLMIVADKVRKIPVIVNYSLAQKELEYDFKEPDYKKLLEMKLPKDSIK